MIYPSSQFIMDFSEIKSVQDLINQNEGVTDMNKKVEELVAPIYKEDPDVGLACVIEITSSLLQLHSDVTDRLIANKDSDLGGSIANWSADLNRLDTVLTLLKEITL